MSEPTVRIEDGVPWIGDRSFPWASMVEVDDHDLSYLELTTVPETMRRRGFHLTFENGWTLSVQWGTGLYCANHDLMRPAGDFLEACPDAELAAWRGVDELAIWDSGDSVQGHVPAELILKLVDSMMAWPSEAPEGWAVRAERE